MQLVDLDINLPIYIGPTCYYQSNKGGVEVDDMVIDMRNGSISLVLTSDDDWLMIIAGGKKSVVHMDQVRKLHLFNVQNN